MIQSPQSLGFSPEAQVRDRSQMAFLSSLMRLGADRYILKGGMAMRALYGSARLTKDVDFDCDDSVSDRSLATRIPNALEQAARSTGIVEQKIDRTKSGERASRWRLVGRTRDSIAVTWEVELSRRGVPDARYVETRSIQPPYEYTIAPFVARVYSETALAAGKVNALLSTNRSVPRDVYDLADLVRRGASPVALWIEHLSRENLERKRDAVLPKVTLIDFTLANAELLPYLARDIRATIDEKRWGDMQLEVAAGVGRWFEDAIPKARTAKEMNRDSDADYDLAGR
ncbi:MAG: nucleotidyl transferase AbiEii/AbiGii toxin family protein [Steroidobacteraceae bacterium]